MLVSLAGADAFAMIDLRVYVDGARHLFDGSLYTFVSGPQQLPFTYPVFSALVFTPLAWLPWLVVRILWQGASVAALAVIVHTTLRLLGRAGADVTRPLPHLRGTVVVVTALALWAEPVRTTLNYGQINLFLVALLTTGAAAARAWYAGGTVGLTAGIKLVPAVTGLYYVLNRQWRAAAFGAAVFAGTVMVSLAIGPSQTWHYFTDLIFDPGRTGPVWSVINQSWRGGLARLAGREVPGAWVIAVIGTVALGGWSAWAALRAGDRTGGLLAVQLIGLLVSPISWSHHWIWVVPILLWIFAGRPRAAPVRVLGGLWVVAVYSYLIPLLIVAQGGSDGPASRPGGQSWAGMAYVLLGMATLVAIGLPNRTTAGRLALGTRRTVRDRAS